MTDLRNTKALDALIAFCRERIDEERVDVDHPNTPFDVRRPVEVRCAALDDLVDAMEAASEDGAPPVDEVGIEALQHIGRIWRHHEDYDPGWAP
ncbi:hypothetical protein [Glutamicibacter sp. V16R2B1]|uniref:hypothetical protein n=1 Tax=Glutamicibacter sp. V16R2B1 TaxID=2036207 RepID=UPI0010FDED8F|nr:hypothetical protein [Glutamicibacter sp. V16R2B1]MCK9901251.1 hypothetical protein [Frankia sp. Cpl3]TLK47191.1 hypothetical protein FDN03_15885 [Glutamicibacter sp. V16R2B1]